MSGIVGILRLDGAPVRGTADEPLLQRMTDSLAFRGPNAQRIWTGASVGLGHALLRVTNDTDPEEQPATLDGDLWIVADARVDGRPDLIRKLRAAGREIAARTPDCVLLLHAYRVWGVACVDHLIGDFAFAIWDAAQRCLFCARDQFGVKPFYYAQIAGSFLFSNTINCLRLHPLVSSNLNDLAIADFLLFDFNQDPNTTSFADIRRLPPAHVLTVENGNVSIHRYWTLPVSDPVDERGTECVEHFRELMDTAVADRLRTDSAAILMSGGLDSATVAASARRIFARQGKASGLRAYTQVFDHLIPHEERYYAGLVASALKIPIEFCATDACGIFDVANRTEYDLPEPAHLPWVGPDVRRSTLAPKCRVALTGLGADPGLSSLLSVHFRGLLAGGRYGRALADAARYLITEGRLSRLYLRTRWRRWFPSRGQQTGYPVWLNEDLEIRLGLRARWESIQHAVSPRVATVRPGAYELVVSSVWPCVFEEYDPGTTHLPLDVRHPFFDVRLMTFLLGLTELPWCSDKQLLRDAARGVLPDAVRLRRKSPLMADPLISLLGKPESQWVDHFVPVPELERYVLRDGIPHVFKEQAPWPAWIHLRPLSLNYWLRGIFESGINKSGG